MQTFLAGVGTVVLVLIALFLGVLAAFALWAWWAVRKLGKGLGMIIPPETVRLRSTKISAKPYAAELASLASLGYERADSVTANGIGGIVLLGHVNEGRRSYAALTVAEGLDPLVDFFARTRDGIDVVATNGPFGTPDRADKVSANRPGATIEELHEGFAALLVGRDLEPVTADGFRGAYEAGYARSMAARAIAAEIESEAEPHEELLGKIDISAAEWEKIRDGVVYVDDDDVWLDEAEIEPEGDESPRETIRRWVQETGRWRYLGSVEHPVPADAYFRNDL